jgi:hypothetical protein
MLLRRRTMKHPQAFARDPLEIRLGVFLRLCLDGGGRSIRYDATRRHRWRLECRHVRFRRGLKAGRVAVHCVAAVVGQHGGDAAWRRVAKDGHAVIVVENVGLFGVLSRGDRGRADQRRDADREALHDFAPWLPLSVAFASQLRRISSGGCQALS